MRALVVSCPASFALLACGFLLVLQAPGLAVGVEEKSGGLFALFANSSRSLFGELSSARAEGVLVVEKDSRVSGRSSCFGRSSGRV